MPYMTLTVRPATRDDLGFLQSLLPRFVSFALPAGHDEGAVMAGAAQNLLAALAEASPDTALLIAWVEEGGQAKRAGFVRVETERPLFGKPYAYLADLALAEWAEGRGLGQALLQHAEAWAAAQGLSHIRLHVFATNERARKLYQAAGYGVEVLSLGKKVRR